MSERDAFWKFAVIYNLSLLSVLYLVLITITTYMLTFRITLGGWSTVLSYGRFKRLSSRSSFVSIAIPNPEI